MPSNFVVRWMQLKQFVILQSSAFVDAVEPERTLNLYYVGDLVDLASRHLNIYTSIYLLLRDTSYNCFVSLQLITNCMQVFKLSYLVWSIRINVVLYVDRNTDGGCEGMPQTLRRRKRSIVTSWILVESTSTYVRSDHTAAPCFDYNFYLQYLINSSNLKVCTAISRLQTNSKSIRCSIL